MPTGDEVDVAFVSAAMVRVVVLDVVTGCVGTVDVVVAGVVGCVADRKSVGRERVSY